MAGAAKTNPAKARKRVEAADNATAASLVRARDGSAFTRCEECKKDVPVALIGFHSCSLDAKIKMNLESQVVEKPAEVKKKKPAERKKSTTSEPKSKRAKTEKKGKDPNMPKRPATAFFIFLDTFRKEFKEANPDSKAVKEVAKQGGEKWKSMTDEEKKPYLEKAAELKAEYEKKIQALNADNVEDENEGEEKENAEDQGEEKENVEDDDDEKKEVKEEGEQKEKVEGEAADYAELEDELSDAE